MANRRMFSKTITNSSNFLMAPLSAQALYLHFGMNADDDGFSEHFSVMRMVGASPDDLRILHLRGLVHVFNEKVLVILDWKENNFLRSDRYTPSKYLKEYRQEIEEIQVNSAQAHLGIPEVNQRDTQDRIGKDRIGKDTEDSEPISGRPILEFTFLFEKLGVRGWRGIHLKAHEVNSTLRLLESHPLDWWQSFMEKYAERFEDRYCPKARTPSELEEKMDRITGYLSKQTEYSEAPLVIKL